MTHSIAQQLVEWVGTANAWTLPTFFKLRVIRKFANQHGRGYVFSDRSFVWIAKGYAKPEVG